MKSKNYEAVTLWWEWKAADELQHTLQFLLQKGVSKGRMTIPESI